jgi:ribonuclease PH
VLGERTITLDCDVLQADGGTRTAAITGAYVALVDAVRWLRARGEHHEATRSARRGGCGVGRRLSAASAGAGSGLRRRFSDCDTDMNVVMNDGGGFIEVQGTAEGHAFRRARARCAC